MMNGCWFCQPVAITSSVPYLIVAVLLILQHRRPHKKLILWSLILAAVGLSSIFAHSSYFRAAMAMDYASIIFLQTFFLFTRMLEVSPLKHLPHKLVFPGYYFFIYVLLLPLDAWPQ